MGSQQVELEDVKRLRLGHGDTLVVTLGAIPSMADRETLIARFMAVFPDNRIIILDPGCELSVLEPHHEVTPNAA